MHTSLPKHDVVLLGVGHTNAHVLRMWRMEPLGNARLTCVSNFPVATYSGMLPGVLAGQYPHERMEIDLVRLCSAAGARLIVGHVTGLDVSGKELLLDDRLPLPFDVLSIGIGSLPMSQGVQASKQSVVPIKPMQTFLTRLEASVDEVLRRSVSPVRVAVVGAGAGGVEVAFCLPARLHAILGHVPYHITLVGASDRLIGGVSAKTSAVALRELELRGVQVKLGHQVTAVTEGSVTLDNGEQIAADMVIWATNAIGSPLLAKFGLPTDEQGFLLTHPTLQSIGDDAIFAVGDTGTIRDRPTPKAGVYAVRQGKVLWENLGRFLRQQPLIEYEPQRSFLKLFNTGDGGALGEYKGITIFGTWVWKLKDWIDSRFMDKYQDYRPMMASPAMSEPVAGPMRCAGCGGKVSAAVLSHVLQRLDIPANPYVLVGLDQPDDAAIIRSPPGSSINVTVDFFAAPFDDPYTVGRIAALNSASDCFAMGAVPIAALASATVPMGPPRQQERLMYELLAGALHEFLPMGATLAGGHTIEGPQLTIGFSMYGIQNGPPRTKGNLRVGDCLILTKPLGTGVLLAGHMQAKCRADWWEPLLHSMLLSNQYAASLCERFDIPGLTDITGFGLAGHLLEMLRPSHAAAELYLSELPLLPGARELIQEGLESTLAPANRLAETDIEVPEADRRKPEYAALFDPQTSGGLLLGVPAQSVGPVLAELTQQSAVPAARIGRVTKHSDEGPRLRIAPSP